MVQLARQGRHATGSGAECAHYAIWIPVSVVLGRGSEAEGVDRCTAVGAGVEAEKRVANPARILFITANSARSIHSAR